MATKVHMEALSPTMEEGQVVKWLKSEGDEVSNGDVLAEIETDKATMELTARGSGVLRKIVVAEGGTAPVGEVIAVIAEEDEDIGDVGGDASGGDDGDDGDDGDGEGDEGEESAAARDDDAEDGAEEEGGEPEEEAEQDAEASRAKAEAPADRGEDGGRVKASPLARRLADEAGLELSSIEGSGPRGRIVKRDVEEAKAGGPARRAPAAALPEEGYEEVPVSQMRKTIAKRLTESLSPVPHFFLTVDVDMDRLLSARARINDALEPQGDKVSVNDMILKATAMALRRHPWCNAAWHGDHVRKYHHVHIGVAVAVEEGLITPVVKNAHSKGLVEISREVRELAGRAREKKLKPEEYTGSTFSISNLGMMGIHEFTAVINPPEAGILAIGATEETPVVMNGEIVVRPRMKITMSCDHRVIDGATGAEFLETLKVMLEEPAAVAM